MATTALTPDQLGKVFNANTLRHAEIRAIFEKVMHLPVNRQAQLIREIAEPWSADYLVFDNLREGADRMEELAREEDEALHGVDVGQRLPGASVWERGQ